MSKYISKKLREARTADPEDFFLQAVFNLDKSGELIAQALGKIAEDFSVVVDMLKRAELR